MMFAFVISTTLALYVILLSVTVVWCVSLYLKDQSIMDVFYGILFLVPGYTLIAYGGSLSHPVYFLMVFFLTIWALRLSFRIARKNIGKGEDWRYRTWRETWETRGKWYFAIRSYVQVFLLQGAVIYGVFSSLIIVYSLGGATTPAILLLGLLVWCIGFFFEVVADWQLDRFLADPANKGAIMRTGLFRYSRRPNYFGESVMWWGMSLMAISTVPWPLAAAAFMSPLIITYIVYAITGPMLEKRWEHNFVYQEYAEQTNYFIPWSPKSRGTKFTSAQR